MNEISNKIVFVFFILLLLTGCSTLGQVIATVPIPLATIRSPITYDMKDVNGPIDEKDKCYLNLVTDEININTKPTKSREMAQKDAINVAKQFCAPPNEIKDNISDKFDSFDDLCSKKSVFFIAISGGGARAAALGKHTMALLEEAYNKEANRRGIINPVPMIDTIDAFSTVSGGSMYAYQVGRINTYLKQAKGVPCLIGNARQNLFHTVNELSRVEHTGAYTTAWYISPFNLFLGPLLTLGTNFNYLHILSGGLNYITYENELEIAKQIKVETKISGIEAIYHRLYTSEIKLSDLEPKPRIFFNATLLETGLPFLFTQRYVNLPSETIGNQTVRLDLQLEDYENNKNKLENLRIFNATTLEDINSSPFNTPLAYAAMASAAYPILLEPLEFTKYGYRADSHEVYATTDRLHLSDGGLYDNSGLTTIIDLIEFIDKKKKNNQCGTEQIILLSINADADSYDLYYPQKEASEESWYQKSPLGLNIPFRWRSLGVDAFELIHFTNKRRAEQIALERTKTMGLTTCASKKDNLQFQFFPVNLQQFSQYDKYQIRDPGGLFEKLQKIPTHYQISSDDSLLLEQAAVRLLSTKQHGWGVAVADTNSEQSLSDAIIKALLDTQLKMPYQDN